MTLPDTRNNIPYYPTETIYSLTQLEEVNFSWAGMTGSQCGVSNSAKWQKDSDTDTWEVKVDTSSVGFAVTPAYVTSLLSMQGELTPDAPRPGCRSDLAPAIKRCAVSGGKEFLNIPAVTTLCCGSTPT